MNRRILHLISGGDTGGAKTHMFSLLISLEKIADVELICFIKDSFYYEAKELGIDIQVLEQKNRADMSVAKKIAKIVKDENFDLVHAHGARANTVAFFLKNQIEVPMITTIHSDYELDFKGNFYKNLIFTTINKIALKRFDYYIAITENFKDLLVSRGFDKDRIYVMYNGIIIEDKPYISKAKFFDKYNVPDDDRPTIVQAARMDAVKNVSMAIDTASDLKKQGIDVKFLLAGDGEEYEDLKSKVKTLVLEDTVYFLGFVEDIYSLYNAGDINILTSHSESFPYAILEAATMGVPTVATDVGGIPEQIRDGIDGFTIPSDNHQLMASRLLELIDDKDKLEKFSQNMKTKVIEQFSSTAMANRQLEIYEDILERNKR